MPLRIRELREARGLTQIALAAKAGMSPSHLAMIEKGTRPANTLRLSAIASALGVRPEELFQGDVAKARLADALARLSADQIDVLVKISEAFAAQNDTQDPKP